MTSAAIQVLRARTCLELPCVCLLRRQGLCTTYPIWSVHGQYRAGRFSAIVWPPQHHHVSSTNKHCTDLNISFTCQTSWKIIILQVQRLRPLSGFYGNLYRWQHVLTASPFTTAASLYTVKAIFGSASYMFATPCHTLTDSATCSTHRQPIINCIL